MYGHPKTLLSHDETIHALTRFKRLAILITAGASGLRATHLPLLYAPPADLSDPKDLGRLVGHVARANDHWHDAEAGPIDALVLCPGPETYISPAWYETKKQTGRAVPTWNYETIHAHGKLRLFTDEGDLRSNVASLSDRHETGREAPWRLEDAPADYLDRLIAGIVGVEIDIERASAKRKLSQEKPEIDRAAVLDALEQSQDPCDREIAAAMRDV
jgi:transcriptional regulator